MIWMGSKSAKKFDRLSINLIGLEIVFSSIFGC